MKNLILIAVSTILLTGCETFTGTLNLYEGISFVNISTRTQKRLDKCAAKNDTTSRKCKKALENKAKNTMVVQAAVYSSTVKPGKDKITVDILDIEGKTIQEFSVKVPKNKKLPEFSGDVSILASESGFNYDIEGTLDTKITNSETYQSVEYCSELVRVPVCVERKEIIKGCDPAVEGQGNCVKRYKELESRLVSISGNQEVEYHNQYTDKDLSISLIKPVDGSKKADFDGKHHDTDKVYTFKGVCYIDAMEIRQYRRRAMRECGEVGRRGGRR